MQGACRAASTPVTPQHVPVAAEATREDHRAIAGAANVDVVSFDYACHQDSLKSHHYATRPL